MWVWRVVRKQEDSEYMLVSYMNVVRVVTTSKRFEKSFVLQSLCFPAAPHYVSDGSTLLACQLNRAQVGLCCVLIIQCGVWKRMGQ